MKTSAGILLYRIRGKKTEVLLVHPGGPFWKNKDAGAWSIPKGEYDAEKEDALETAKREFKEETSSEINGLFVALDPVKQRSGKMVYAWAVEGDIDITTIKSNTIPIEWPPRSGKTIEISEVDRGEWLDMDTALVKINPGQVGLLHQLAALLNK